ncbi:hypothetical protein CTEN210_07639 [Chaetoceros tenuissimus]|uniref:HMG box domain-containing protein n=1 Tax=Chaetoceros tenuissimus TaxID=426638 RepID=A0AAD3CSL5_9STRA|nr:hypothetical protein CTEN210_07639 [Chaetoceros tenuissimus]
MEYIEHSAYPSDNDHLEWLDNKFIEPIPFYGSDHHIGNPFLKEKSLPLLKNRKQGRWQQEEQFEGRYTNQNNTVSVEMNHDVPLELDHPQPLYYHDNAINPSSCAPPPPVTSTSIQYLGLPSISTTASIDHKVQQNNLGNEANEMIERRYQRHDSNGYHPSTAVLQERQIFSMIPSSGSSPNHVSCSSTESEQYPHSVATDPSSAEMLANSCNSHGFEATTSSYSLEQPRYNISTMRETTPTLRNTESLDFEDVRDNGAQSIFAESKFAHEFAHPSSYEGQTTQYYQPWYFDQYHRACYHHPLSTIQETTASGTDNQQFHPRQFQSYSKMPVESSRHPFAVYRNSLDDHQYPSPQVQSSTSANYAESTQKKRSFEECSVDGEVTNEKNPRRPISAYNFFFMEEKEIVIALLSSTNTLRFDDHSNDHDFSVIKDLDADGLFKYLNEVSKSIDYDKLNDFQESIHKKTEEFLLVHFEEDRSKKPHKKRHGLVSFLNLARVIGMRWRALSPELKKRYHDLASKDKKRFNEMVNN